MFTTRTSAIAFLVSTGAPEAMARVAVNECFNTIPHPDDDLLRTVTSLNTAQLCQVDEATLRSAYDDVIANDFDAQPDGIYILDVLKYDINGNPLLPDEDKQNAPSSDTVQ
jgi:hypothetical protein